MFKGRSIVGLKSYEIARLGIGYVPENRDIFGALTVEQNLQLGVKVGRSTLRWSMADTYRLFPVLDERRDAPAGVLSGGEQQMLTICRTLMGETAADCAAALGDAGADVVGANCGKELSVLDYAEITSEIASASGLPIIVQPNAGQPKLVNGRTVHDDTPETWAADLPKLIDAGARIIGGCCGTGPEHIALLRRLLDERNGAQ